MSFDDLAAFTALPRLTGLALSLDGTRLIAVQQQPDGAGARYSSSLWEIDLGGGAPRRLTHSDKGEAAPAFRPDGSLLFVSSRPDAGGDDDDAAALWCLPPAGEPYVLTRRPGGVGGPVVASASGDVLMTGSRLTYSVDADDAERRKTRKDRKVTAILHTGMPIRYWDHELGDETPRLLVAASAAPEPRDLAPDATTELLEASYSISADGTTVATTWRPRRPQGNTPYAVSLIDVLTGERSVLAAADGYQYSGPVISPDGSRVALEQSRDGSFDRPPLAALLIMPVSGGEPVRADLGDLFPTSWVWSADSHTLYVTGDWHGRGAVVAVDPSTGGVEATLADDAVYSSLCPSPDGTSLYALRSTIDAPPHPVRLDVAAGPLVALQSPAAAPELPGELMEIVATAADGASVHGWVCLPPPSDTPAPVMLWIHGGPFGSWNAWSWRWNPWVAVAQGWAVVLPDPALSTGYGHGWFERAWPYLAADVFADCAAVLDAVLELPDVDPARVACLGASFGGYMTNWVAGHTDRFQAIVTHAGLWALDQQHKTTDAAQYKTAVFGEPSEHPDWYEQNSPHNGQLNGTPMLVIHGNRDYRVPVSEALRLWWDLVSSWGGPPDTMPHRFLQLTTENHWVLSPANTEVWYDVVLGFCAEQVLGAKWTPSPLL